MKAIFLSSSRAPMEIREVAKPEPGDDEVLVKVSGCGVCHTDIGFWMQGVPTKKELPLILGHEISGRVVEAGRNTTQWLHKEVIVPAVIPCGNCKLCESGRGNICQGQLMPGNDIHGGFAEFIVTPGRGLCPVEQTGDYDLSELAVIADAVTTPYQAVVRSGLSAGDLAIVNGVGGVGGYCAQIAAAFGARVIALDVDAGKLEAIAPHGARATINAGDNDFKSLKRQIRGFAKEWGCLSHSWKIFECSGHAAGQQTAFGLLTPAATLMVIGFTLEKLELRLSNLMAMDATVQGTWGCKPELYPEALKLVTDGKITLKPFIQTFPMSEGPSVLDRVAAHEIDKRAILVPNWQA